MKRTNESFGAVTHTHTHEHLKNKKAITLIALVITIVVLIILAGVAINLSLGNNGIFNKAKYAREEYLNAKDKEETELSKATNDIDTWTRASQGNNPQWTEIYNGAITSISNLDISKYKELRIGFSLDNGLYDGWNYFTTSYISSAFQVSTFGGTSYLRITFNESDGKISYYTCTNVGWNTSTFKLVIEGY